MSQRKWVRPSSDRILEAAERVITKEGYAETSLRQLMTAAGVSTTAFYARFASKEDVLRALVGRLLGQLASAATDELIKADGLEDGFRRGVDVLFDVLSPKRALVRIALTEAAASADSRAAMGGLYSSLAGLLTHQIESMTRDKSARDFDASAVSWAIVGALNVHILRWAVYDQLTTEELRAVLHTSAQSFLPVLAPMLTSRNKRPRAVAG